MILAKVQQNNHTSTAALESPLHGENNSRVLETLANYSGNRKSDANAYGPLEFIGKPRMLRQNYANAKRHYE